MIALKATEIGLPSTARQTRSRPGSNRPNPAARAGRMPTAKGGGTHGARMGTAKVAGDDGGADAAVDAADRAAPATARSARGIRRPPGARPEAGAPISTTNRFRWATAAPPGPRSPRPAAKGIRRVAIVPAGAAAGAVAVAAPAVNRDRDNVNDAARAVRAVRGRRRRCRVAAAATSRRLPAATTRMTRGSSSWASKRPAGKPAPPIRICSRRAASTRCSTFPAGSRRSAS